MSQSVTDFNAARQCMVDSQIRPVPVRDERIIRIMRELPREECVPATVREVAYSDRSIPLGGERFLTEPRVIARLLEAAAPREGERALLVGAATGYVAALLSRLGLEVFALEQNHELAQKGQAYCARFAPSVKWWNGPLESGWETEAAYDLIVIDGAVREIPPLIAAQLAPSGRLCGILQPWGKPAVAVLAEPSQSGLKTRFLFDAAVPLLLEMAHPPGFIF